MEPSTTKIMQSKFYLDNKNAIDYCVEQALKEDIGAGDCTSEFLFKKERVSIASLWIKSDGVIAGIELAGVICSLHNSDLKWLPKVQDGTALKKGALVGQIHGPIKAILEVERLILNCMQRMSGIATYTKACVAQIRSTPTQLLDTRKTTPNFRCAEKWAVHLGGAQNHRMGLFDMLLIKDNHSAAHGGLKATLELLDKQLKSTPTALPIVVEIHQLNEIEIALQYPWIDRLLLDNMQPHQLDLAVKKINGKLATEASGNINLSNLLSYAETGVDYISMGALTYAAEIVDISLKMNP